jgi:hypothetical protein
MSELLRRAGEIRREQSRSSIELQRQQAANEAATQADLKERRRISAERLSEFIGLMIRGNVPKIPVYIEEQYTPPGYYSGSGKRISEMGYTRLGEGWIAREHRPSTWDDVAEPGLFVCTSSEVYTCQKASQEPPVGAAERYKREWPEGEYVLVDSRHEHGKPYPYDDGVKTIAFSDEDGPEVLARALVRYGVTG